MTDSLTSPARPAALLDLGSLFPGLVFEEVAHRYTHPLHIDLDGQPRELLGATSWLKQFRKPFDAEAVAGRKAAKETRYGRPTTAAELLAAWDRKRKASCELGTRVHSFIEGWWQFVGGVAAPPKWPSYARHGEYAAQFACWYYTEAMHLRALALEGQLYHLRWGLAGTLDALLEDEQSRRWVYDWKTNGEITTASKYREKLLAPFADLDDCDLEVYSLQTSLYRLLLASAGIETVGARLVHVTPDGCSVIEAKDYTARLAQYLNSAAK